MKNKAFTAILMFLTLAITAHASSVAIFSAYYDTMENSTSINSGEDVSFVISANSVLEPSMTIVTDLVNSTGQSIRLIESTTPLESYSRFYTITPNIYGSAGQYTIKTTVTAASGSTETTSLFLTILPLINGNNPPYFTSNPLQNGTEGSFYSYQSSAIDPEGAAITYTLTQYPAWISINQATGVISGTAPSVNADTVYAITIRATDGTYNITQTYPLTIFDQAQQAPSVSAALFYQNSRATTLNVPNGNSVDIALYAASVNEQSMTIRLDILDAQGNIIATPVNQLTANNSFTSNYTITQAVYGGLGNYTILETVRGASGAQANATLTLIVTQPLGLNSAPIITSTPTISITEGANYSYQMAATDADGDLLSYLSLQMPTWLTIDPATGLISGTAPQVAQDTNYTIIVGVTDGINPAATQQFDITVTDIPAGIVLAQLSYNGTFANNYALIFGQSVIINADASSLFEPYMTVLVELLDSNNTIVSTLSYANATGTYSNSIALTSSQYSLGNFTIRETVIGASGSNSTSILYLQVFPQAGVNNPPQITSMPITSVNEGSAYAYQVIATDADNDNLTYSLVGAPTWISFNQGLIFGQAPIYGENTSFNLTVAVSDGIYTATQQYELTVVHADFTGIFNLSISTTSTIGIAPLNVNFTSRVTGQGPFIFAWDFNNDSIIDSIQDNASVTYSAAGTYTAVLTVTNSTGAQASASVGIIVFPAGNVPPGSNVTNATNITQQPGAPSVDENVTVVDKMMIESIYYEEVIKAGDVFEVYVNTKDPIEKRGSVSVELPELGVYQKYGSMMRSGRTSNTVMLDIPSDASPGVYDMKIVVYQDGQERRLYRQVEII